MDKKEKSQACREAELYYLSIAFGGEYGDAPIQIADHVRFCDYCIRRLKILKDQLLAADAIDSDDSRLSNAQLHILGLYFAYLGKKVGCETVKPFLPSLLEPSFNIRIPTPISVHIDRCELCNRDLASIQAMGLTEKQLEILNSMLGYDSSVQNVDCTVAAASIKQFVNFDFQAIKPEVIKHLCYCKVCQSLVYRDRALTIKNLLSENVKTAFPCESVTFADVFDYCFPYGLVPYSDQYAAFRQPFVNELKRCAKCLQKVQDLHKRVTFIKQRPESGIVTVYEIGEMPISEAAPETQENHCGFPINVSIEEQPEKQLLPSIQQEQLVKQNVGTRIFKAGLKNIAKAAVAAAVILAVFLFLRSTPKATAVTIEQVYDAIQKTVNVHIRQFTAESSGPLQEKWVSKDLGIYAVKDKTGFVVWDVSGNAQYRKTTGSSKTKTTNLFELQSAAMQKKIRGSLGLMPFDDVSEIPRNAEWQELNVSAMEGVSAGTRVFELTWTMPTPGGSIVRSKWRGFIEKSTNRPLRTEFYMHDSSSADYELQTVHLVEYWTENEMRTFLMQHLP
jgi:hypothetical protein